MNREEMLERARESGRVWDILVIGGGATGAGAALDAASRGYSVLLLEQHDFGKGTSSRSTKLVHGGVRYLEQGNLSLVMDALRERETLRKNAEDLVTDQAFIVPSYRWWERPYYGAGLLAYNLLAGPSSFGKSRIVSRDETLRRVPTLNPQGLHGGVEYHDGQFDDSRVLIRILQTAVEHGAVVVNYCPVIDLRGDARVAVAVDMEGGQEFAVQAKVIVNATGAFCDDVRRMGRPEVQPLVAPSQGAHLVFDASFLPGDTGFLVPRTPDGRVMFAIPWHGHTLVGTTDVPVPRAELEPRPLAVEIDFILETAGRYLAKQPARSDILSCWAGIRPLVSREGAAKTAALSRDHVIHIDPSGLLTITGGKWTTYRKMAEECIDKAAAIGELTKKPCKTRTLRLRKEGAAGEGAQLHPGLPYITGDILLAAREEMARTLEDALARRTRALFLDASAAVQIAGVAADLMAIELGRSPDWAAAQVECFNSVALGYLPTKM